MRFVSILLTSLILAACSGSDSGESPNKAAAKAPPFDIDVTNDASTETKAERTARLRKKAESDPEGADAEAIENMGQNEVLATAINSAGYLCARIVSAYPVGGSINVECIEYRNGSGRVRYRIDPNAGTVEPR